MHGVERTPGMKTPSAGAPSRQGFSRLRWRVRRALSLAASHRCIAHFAGGYLSAAGIALDLLRARGLGAVLGWATTAAAHGQYLDAKRYNRWLESRPRTRNSGSVLVAASTLGIDRARRSAFLRLLAAQLHRLRQGAGDGRIACLLVTDPAGEATFQALPDVRLLNASVASVETPTLSAMLGAVRERAAGEFDHVALMKPGYLPGALTVPAGKAGALVYGDEDRIDATGSHMAPFFKPAFSPDLLLARDYLGSLLLPAGMATTLPEDVEDYHSLVLRLVEQATAVEHVDAVLAHRFAPPCTSEPATPPGYLPQFLRNRYGPAAEVVATCAAAVPWRCDFGHRDASVSVILLTRDRLPLLRNCIEGIFASNHGDFEVIVLDNESEQPETLDWLAGAAQKWPALKVVPAPGPFNWSRLNNLGMAHAHGDVFVFLNNDTEPRSKNWLARLADVALRPDIGAVGALLLYASGRIQHAGVVVGDGRWADHIYRGDFPDSHGHVFVPPNLPRNVCAVTGACMALSRRTVERIGPFDEDYLVAGSDVEICIRALNHGLLNAYLPDVVLLHLESQTRGRRDPASDVARLVELLQATSPEDPYFSRHLRAAPLYITRRGANTSVRDQWGSNGDNR